MINRIKPKCQLVPDTQMFQHIAKFSLTFYKVMSPVEELRYRRTVIVTAAVYRSLTLLHFAQKTQYIKLKTKYYFKYSVFSIKSFVRSTTPLNLPALGRRQPVYLRLTLLHGPVFLINSRLAIISCDLAPCTRNIKSNT